MVGHQVPHEVQRKVVEKVSKWHSVVSPSHACWWVVVAVVDVDGDCVPSR